MNLFDPSVGDTALPDFICVGAEKAGSTALYDCLRSHPDIYMSPIKETNFFSTDVRVENFRADYQRHENQKHLDLDKYFGRDSLTDMWGAYVREPEHYLHLFREGHAFRARGEVCNSYLYSGEAARNIADSLPEVRILAVLRDPVSRAFSQYRAMVRDGRAEYDNLIDEVQYDLSFADRRWGSCHGYIDHGLYGAQLERLFSIFDRDRVKIVLADQFFDARDRVMQDIYEFLDLPYSAAYQGVANRNLSAAPRSAGLIRLLARSGLKQRAFALLPERYKPAVKRVFFSSSKASISAAEFDFLYPYFAADIEHVERVLDTDLSAWRRPGRAD